MGRAGRKGRLRGPAAHSPGDWGCFLEAWFWLGIARLAILTLSFRRISRHLGVADPEFAEAVRPSLPAHATGPAGPHPAIQDAPEAAARVKRVVWALDAATRRSPWRCTCLVRALAGRAMLHRRRISSSLYLGAAPDAGDERALSAHAWLRSGRLVVTGGEEATRFTPVVCFGERFPELEKAR